MRWGIQLPYAPAWNAALLASFTLVSTSVGQCDPSWAVGLGLAGCDGQVRASTCWDPDGPGPLPTLIVFGGDFGNAGNTAARNLVAWEPTTGAWSELAGGTGGPVNSLTVLPGGELLVGGEFTTVGAVVAANIAVTDGQTWAPLGSGTDRAVLSTAVLPNGEVAVGGRFVHAGGVVVNRIARWNGSSWSPCGAGVDDDVFAVAAGPGGDLIIGGAFVTANGAAIPGLARWDGVTFQPVGAPVQGITRSMIRAANADLVVAVDDLVLRWDGAVWTTLGAALQVTVDAVFERANGNLVAAATGYGTGDVAEWSGTAWSVLGSVGYDTVATVTELPSGLLAVGGGFSYVAGKYARGIATFDGATWSAPPGIDKPVDVVLALEDGTAFVGGSFGTLAGVTEMGVARWNGAGWEALGTGFGGLIHELMMLPSGDLVAGGFIPSVGGVTSGGVARWDGHDWQTIGGGLGPFSFVLALARRANGDLIAAGAMLGIHGNVARFDGTSWSRLDPTGGPNGFVHAVLELPSGHLMVAGEFTHAAGQAVGGVALWDGMWAPVGGGITGAVHHLRFEPNGDVIACGSFTQAGGVPANGIARWDGSSWSALGSPAEPSRVSARLPNGDIVAVWSPSNDLMRWDGASWTRLAEIGGSEVSDLAFDGEWLYVVGDHYIDVAGTRSFYVSRLASPCPASVTSIAPACAGSAGPLELTSTPPWIGATVTETATGLPQLSVVAVVRGYSVTSVPLQSVLPPGQAGCALDVVPDMVDVALVNGGLATSDYALPDEPSLVGMALYSQWVSLELGPAGQVVTAVSTNALRVQVGMF